jgi:hypothetical protein
MPKGIGDFRNKSFAGLCLDSVMSAVIAERHWRLNRKLSQEVSLFGVVSAVIAERHWRHRAEDLRATLFTPSREAVIAERHWRPLHFPSSFSWFRVGWERSYCKLCQRWRAWRKSQRKTQSREWETRTSRPWTRTAREGVTWTTRPKPNKAEQMVTPRPRHSWTQMRWGPERPRSVT